MDQRPPLAKKKNYIFFQIWRTENYVKFGKDLIWRMVIFLNFGGD